MAHTKAKGTSKLGRESESKRLGVKRFDGQIVKPGDILVRQRGTQSYTGINVRRGNDDTLYSVAQGTVKFLSRKKIAFNGSRKQIRVVTVQA